MTKTHHIPHTELKVRVASQCEFILIRFSAIEAEGKVTIVKRSGSAATLLKEWKSGKHSRPGHIIGMIRQSTGRVTLSTIEATGWAKGVC